MTVMYVVSESASEEHDGYIRAVFDESHYEVAQLLTDRINGVVQGFVLNQGAALLERGLLPYMVLVDVRDPDRGKARLSINRLGAEFPPIIMTVWEISRLALMVFVNATDEEHALELGRRQLTELGISGQIEVLYDQFIERVSAARPDFQRFLEVE